jgi:hypothetical protein
MKDRKVIEWMEQEDERITRLFKHFLNHGVNYASKEELVVDMLSDVIDVWDQAHETPVCENH